MGTQQNWHQMRQKLQRLSLEVDLRRQFLLKQAEKHRSLRASTSAENVTKQDVVLLENLRQIHGPEGTAAEDCELNETTNLRIEALRHMLETQMKLFKPKDTTVIKLSCPADVELLRMAGAYEKTLTFSFESVPDRLTDSIREMGMEEFDLDVFDIRRNYKMVQTDVPCPQHFVHGYFLRLVKGLLLE